MTRSARYGGVAVAVLFMFAAVTGALAQEATPTPSGLPGGASSLTETHGDWQISCRLGHQGEQTTKLCAMAQQRTNDQGQQILAVELRSADEGARGVLMLPFGLAITQGVTIQIDDGKPGEPLPFSTCLSAGCIVPIVFDADMIAGLRQGTTLDVTASVVNGGQTNMTISLAGFTSALNRLRELLK